MTPPESISPDGDADLRANRPRPPLKRELVLYLAVFALYFGISNFGGPRRESIALDHGRDLFDLEHTLHIAIEQPLNAWLAPRTVLATIANYEYAFMYVATAFGLLGYLYVRRPDYYRWARSSFALINLIGISIFAIYPTAPPRLLPGTGYIDTVTDGHTFGSWGSPLVDNANHLAAMPSLHVAWGLWFSVVLGVMTGKRWVQAICGLHVLVTTYVIMATANHFVLDAVGGALVVLASFGLMALVGDRPHTPHPRLAAADAFFLHSETATGAPQHVGGVIVMRGAADGDAYRAQLLARFKANIGRMPRFRHRVAEGTFWRRPRWEPAGDIDWDWHLPTKDLSRPDGSPGGQAALEEFVAGLQENPLPRDRPLWRFYTVTGTEPGEVIVVLTVHHVVSDGMATIFTATRLFDPLPTPSGAEPPRLSLRKRVAGVTVGIAQLARDGVARHRLPSGAGRDRRYGMSRVPTSVVRAVAQSYGVHVSDVLLSASAGAMRQVLAADVARDVRVTVPLTLRSPTDQSAGNVTAAVLIDLPLGLDDEVERLRETARRSGRLRSGTRAMGGRFVIGTATGALPPPAQRWFAQFVYGKRFFEAIVSNMVGPKGEYQLAGGAVHWVHPVVPLAPGSPVAVGIIGWDRFLDIGVSADPEVLDDARQLASGMVAVIDELSRRAGVEGAPRRMRSSEEFGPFWPVLREESIPVRKDVR